MSKSEGTTQASEAKALCRDTRNCFARTGFFGELCGILKSTDGSGYAYHNDGECPFCKIKKEEENKKEWWM